MREITIESKRYAQAAFEIARQTQQIEGWRQDLASLATLAGISELVAVMENPAISIENQIKLLNSQIKIRQPMAANLVYLLIERGKFGLIQTIKQDFELLVDEEMGIQKAEVVTAMPLDIAEKQKIIHYLSEIQNKKILLTEKVDPQIIGGMIARVGGKIIDGSTRSQLEALKNRITESGG